MKKKKINFVLVVPPSSQILSSSKKTLQKSPPEGISYIAATLKQAGYSVDIIDFRGEGNFSGAIPDKDQTVIGITTFADSFCFLEDFIQKIKANRQDSIVILGGPLVTAAPEILMKILPVDYAVLGEGELSILKLMNNLSENKKESIFNMPGVGYKKAGEIFLNLSRPQTVNLDNLPLLDFSFWPTVKERGKLEIIGLSSARGCRGQCTFRFRAIPLIREMSPSRFGRQISFLVKKHGLEFLFLNDLTFANDRKRALELCKELKKTGIKWACDIRLCSTRTDVLDERLFRIMKESGCQEIYYGLESVNQKVLDINFKGVNIKDLDTAIKVTGQAGIRTIVNVVIGLPGETEKSLDELVSFMETRKIIPSGIKYFVPLPGTSVYSYARKNGLIKDEPGYFRMLSRRKGNTLEDEIINCTDIPEEKLKETFMRLVQIRNKT